MGVFTVEHYCKPLAKIICLRRGNGHPRLRGKGEEGRRRGCRLLLWIRARLERSGEGCCDPNLKGARETVLLADGMYAL